MKKVDPKDRYNRIVKQNISAIQKNNIEKLYSDPDGVFDKQVIPQILINGGEVKEYTISMATDGVCGIKKLQEFCHDNDDLEEKYRLLRENLFDFLAWPRQSMSINQKKGFKNVCDDRLDLVLVEIEKFYNIAKENKTFDLQFVKKIDDNCRRLSACFLNMPTLLWLCSYKDFNSFIAENNLTYFVNEEGGNCVAILYDNKSNSFTKDYFDNLCTRVKKYKDNMNHH